MKANTDIELKTRRTLTLGNFRGVDLSSSPLAVRSDRASKMRNFINEYGVNKKRNGWNELLKIKRDGTAQRINGIFEYSNGARHELLLHAGRRFYRVIGSGDRYSYEDITLSSSYAPARCKAELLKDQRSQAFINKGRMYIIGCGDYLVYGSWNDGSSWELRRVVDNEDTYVPTTTISIDPDDVADDTRGTLDDINCLSSKRINQLLGSADADKSWTLDSGEIDAGTTVDIRLETIEGTEEGESAVEYLISNCGEDKTKLYKTHENGEELEPIECGALEYATGRIKLSIPTAPQIENRDNIYVTFQHTVEGYSERITDCSFGILFGVNGNTDRLFLSGNSEYPNIDFHSEMDDYTYFGDLNTASMGSDSVPIIGYARLSDSTLVVYKAESGHEASIFYRTGAYSESYDTSGGLVSIRGVFPTSAGSIGEAPVSRYACVNFGGDNVILSKNGVFGIVLVENVATTERYTRERSRSINKALKQHADLSEAVGIVYDGRYYLAVDDVCYVADSRYKYTSEDDVDGSYNYEWWFWDNVPVRVWAHIGNGLYFGSDDGQVCVFDDKYTDRTYYQSAVGDISLDIYNNRIVYNQNILSELVDGDRIKFSSSSMLYALALDNVCVDNGRIKIPEDRISLFHDEMKVFADNVGESGLSLRVPYYVTDVDVGECTILLKDENGELISLEQEGFRLCYLLTDTELYITDISISEKSFKLRRYKTEDELILVKYGDALPDTDALSATITHIQNVVAEFYTPVLDFGTNESSKTLLKLTVSTEPEINGKLSFGYETKSMNRLINAKGINVFSLDDLSFENFSFDTGFANSYSVKCNERNFNFMIFRFISDNDSNCIVNTLTVLYKINKANKGVR